MARAAIAILLVSLFLVVTSATTLADESASHGWARYDSPLDGPCTVDRVHWTEMTADRFDGQYRDHKPVVLTGMRGRNDAFRNACAKDVLLREWGDKDIKDAAANLVSD